MKRLLALLLVAGCTKTGPVPGPRQSGAVTIEQTAGNGSGELTASFTVDTCVTRAIGTCSLVDCRGAAAPMYASAGTITITGANAMLALIPINDGTYPDDSLSGEVFRAGNTLHVVAPGSTVPAFTADVKAPKPLVLLSPFGGSLQVDRSRDFNVSWATAIDDGVRLRITLDSGATLECDWGGHDLMQPVPSFALELLGPGTGRWSVVSANTKVLTAAGFVVTVAAVQDAQDTRNTSAEGPLEIL